MWGCGGWGGGSGVITQDAPGCPSLPSVDCIPPILGPYLTFAWEAKERAKEYLHVCVCVGVGVFVCVQHWNSCCRLPQLLPELVQLCSSSQFPPRWERTWRLKRADFVHYAAVFAILLIIRVVVLVEQLFLVDYHPDFPFHQLQIFSSTSRSHLFLNKHTDTHNICILLSFSGIGLRLHLNK